MPRDNDTIVFEVKEHHLTLLRHMYVGWCDDEFGAPEIDPKRPYGNSSVLLDIREILSDENASDAELETLHRETQTVLQIALRTGSFEPGLYVADKYTRNWERVPF